MQELMTKTNGILGRTAGALCIGLVAVAISGASVMAAEAGDQEQSLSRLLLNQPTPDPAIAEGLEVFDQGGSSIGRLSEVVDRGGQRMAVLAPVQRWSGQRSRTIPYSSLSVINGIITYRPE